MAKKSKRKKAGRTGPGRPRKLDGHQLFSLRLPQELHRELRLYAASQDKSLNDLLIQVLKEWWSGVPERRTIRNLTKR